MIRKAVITTAVFLIVGVCVFAAGTVADSDVSTPQVITAESACPVVGCASGECHGFDNVPEPDGVHEMTCPKVSCSSVECHAWDSLTSRYHQASDASLNLWILAPVVLVLGLVILVKRIK